MDPNKVATWVTYQSNPYKYQAAFIAAERGARERGWGLWSVATCNGDTEQAADAPAPPPIQPVAPKPPTPKPAASKPIAPKPTKPPVLAAKCDPSYPDVCIPPYPPDLDCGDIPFRRFRVIGADPHRFDGDHDGIGCER